MARIFLIGPMGSGKTTVGKALARKLDYPFIDTDKEIEARCGVDIPTIFEFEGEAGFRDREQKIIEELTNTGPVILATGGGSILDETNRKHLNSRGHVILLSVDIKEQLRRVSLNKNRPLLQVGDVEEKLVKLMAERRELYESTAHHIVNTNSSRMQNVLAKILRHLQKVEIIAATDITSRNTSKSSPRSGAKKSSRQAAKTKSAEPGKNKAEGTSANRTGEKPRSARKTAVKDQKTKK